MSKVEFLNEEELTAVVGGKKSKKGGNLCNWAVTAGVAVGSMVTLNPWGGVAAGLGAASAFCF